MEYAPTHTTESLFVGSSAMRCTRERRVREVMMSFIVRENRVPGVTTGNGKVIPSITTVLCPFRPDITGDSHAPTVDGVPWIPGKRGWRFVWLLRTDVISFPPCYLRRPLHKNVRVGHTHTTIRCTTFILIRHQLISTSPLSFPFVPTTGRRGVFDADRRLAALAEPRSWSCSKCVGRGAAAPPCLVDLRPACGGCQSLEHWGSS